MPPLSPPYRATHGCGVSPTPARRSRTRSDAEPAPRRGGQYDWSPEQIVGWLRQTCPEDEQAHVSHETIYRSLFVQARRAR